MDEALFLEINSEHPDERHMRDLVSAGANVNAVKDGDSVLMKAIDLVSRGLDSRFVKLLVELGADVNAVIEEGACPLWEACLICSPELVEYLIQHGATPNVVLDQSESLLDWAEFDQWYHTSESLGDADSHDGVIAAALAEVIAVLKKHGAQRLCDLQAQKVLRWVSMFASHPTGLVTGEGNLDVAAIAGVDAALAKDFRQWRETHWDSWPDKDFSKRPPDFDRAAHNAWGRCLAERLRGLIPRTCPSSSPLSTLMESLATSET